MSAAVTHRRRNGGGRGKGYSHGFYHLLSSVLEFSSAYGEIDRLSALEGEVSKYRALMENQKQVVDAAHLNYIQGKASYKKAEGSYNQAGDDFKLHNKTHNKKVLQDILQDFDMSKDVKQKSRFVGGSKFSLNHEGSTYEYSKVPKSIKKAVAVVLSNNNLLELPVDDFLNNIKTNILKSKKQASFWQKIKSWFKRSKKTKRLYSELENMGADSRNKVVNTALCSGVDKEQLADYRKEFRANKVELERAQGVYDVSKVGFEGAKSNYKSEKSQYDATNKQYLEQEALCIAYNIFYGFLVPPSLFETAAIDSTSWQYRLLVDAGLDIKVSADSLDTSGWQRKVLNEAGQDTSSWQWLMLDEASKDKNSWQGVMLHEASKDTNSWQYALLSEVSQNKKSWQGKLLSKAASDFNSDEFKIMSEFNKDPDLYNQLVSSVADTHEFLRHRSNSSGTFEHVGFMFRDLYNKEGKDKKRYSHASGNPLPVVPMFKSSSIEGARSIGLYYDEFQIDYKVRSNAFTYGALAVFDPQSKQENKDLLNEQGVVESDKKKCYGAHGTSGDAALAILSTTPTPGGRNFYGKAFYQARIRGWSGGYTSLSSLFCAAYAASAFATTADYSRPAARAAGGNSKPVVLFYANKFTTNKRSYANLKNGGTFLLHKGSSNQQRIIPKMLMDQA